MSQSREVDPKALRRSSLSYWGDESGDDNSGSSSRRSPVWGDWGKRKIVGWSSFGV